VDVVEGTVDEDPDTGQDSLRRNDDDEEEDMSHDGLRRLLLLLLLLLLSRDHSVRGAFKNRISLVSAIVSP
jgi:hypothetical protein